MLCACRGSSSGRRDGSRKSPPGGGRFFFTPDSCNEIVRALTRLHPESIVDVVARAEAVLGGGSSADRDPSRSFTLARAYRYTQQRRFLDGLLSFYGENGGDGVHPSYDQQMVWRAAHVFSDLHSVHLVDDPTHPAGQSLRKSLHSNVAGLSRIRKSTGSLPVVMASGAVAMGCICFPELPAAERRREWGLSNLADLVSGYVYPARPVSLGERCLVAEVYLSLIILSQHCGIEVPHHVIGGVEALIDGIAEGPEVTANRVEDGLVLDITPFEAASSRQAILALGSVLFDRRDLSGSQFRASETLAWLVGLEGLDEFETMSADSDLLCDVLQPAH